MTNGAQNKGLGPLAWVAIGCGGLVLVGIVGFVAIVGFGFFKAKEIVSELEANPTKTIAETAVRLNPELELVESDDDAGTMTIKNTKTGEVATLNFEDIAEGKFSVTTSEGDFSVDASSAGDEGSVTFKGPEGEVRLGASASLEGVPDWVPIYPEASETQGTYNAATAEGISGIVTSKTSDGMQKVVDYYKKKLEGDGYTITSQSATTTQQGGFGAVTGELPDKSRSVNVGIVEQGGETGVTVNYNAKQ